MWNQKSVWIAGYTRGAGPNGLRGTERASFVQICSETYRFTFKCTKRPKSSEIPNVQKFLHFGWSRLYNYISIFYMWHVDSQMLMSSPLKFGDDVSSWRADESSTLCNQARSSWRWMGPVLATTALICTPLASRLHQEYSNFFIDTIPKLQISRNKMKQGMVLVTG